MFGTILDINSSGDILLDKKFIHLVPEFNEVYNDKNLGGTMLKYIILVYDHQSPFRHLPFEVRREDASERFFGKKDHSRCSHPTVKKAIELYQYVQYDPLRDQYEALVQKNKEKIKIFDLIEVTESNFKDMNDFESKLLTSSEKLEGFKKRLEIHEEEKKMLGEGAELSFIEEKLIKYRKESVGE